MLLNRFALAAPDLFRRELDNLFETFFDGAEGRGFLRPRGFPAVNVWEDGERLYAEAEVPGLTMNDLELSIVGHELTIKGTRKGREDKDLNFHRQERGAGEFARTLALPVEIDADKVEATLKDGVLTIVLPKAEAARPRKITVKSN